MTENRRPIADEMAKIREERQQAQDSPETASIHSRDDSGQTEPRKELQRRRMVRTIRDGTPLDHIKAFAHIKKTQQKKKKLRDRLRRFFK